MELSEAEKQLKFKFPERHRQAILDSSDPIHKACDFLVLSDGQHGDILRENKWIHSPEIGEPWPDFLVAFASNGCGDYFAYDTRQNPAYIIYIDPDMTTEENLQAPDKLCFKTFDNWYESQIKRCTCRRCQSREARFEASHDKEFLLRVCPRCGFQEDAAVIEP